MSPPPSPPPPSLPCSGSDTPNAFPFAENYGIRTDCTSTFHEFSNGIGRGEPWGEPWGAKEDLAAFCAKTVPEAKEAFELAGIFTTTGFGALESTAATPNSHTYTWEPPVGFGTSDRVVDICPDTCATFGVYVSGCAPPALPPSPSPPPPSPPPSPTPPPPSPPSPTSPPPKSPPLSPSTPAEGAGVVAFSITVAGTVDDFDADSYTSKLAAVLDVEKADVTLVVAAASVRVTAEVLVAEASVAMAALRALACDRRQDVGVCGAASNALGVEVEAVDEPVYVTERQHISPPSPPNAGNTDLLPEKQVTDGKIAEELTIAIAVGAAALLGCACAMACLWRKCRKSRIVALEHGNGGKTPTNPGVDTRNVSELSDGARALATVPFCDGAILQVSPPENSLPGSPIRSAQKSAQRWLATKVEEDADEVPPLCGDHRV